MDRKYAIFRLIRNLCCVFSMIYAPINVIAVPRNAEISEIRTEFRKAARPFPEPASARL